MKKLSKWVLLLLLVPVLALWGCGPSDTDDQLYKANYDFTIKASCSENQISLDISNKDTRDYANGTQLDVRMLKPYEYYDGETDRGVHFNSTEYAEGSLIGVYTVGNAKTINIDRYTLLSEQGVVATNENAYDNLYNKFVLAKDGKLVAGPFFIGDIESKRNYAETEATTKKGIISQNNDIVAELGCGWTEYNVNPNNFFFPNERVDDNGNIIQIDNSYLSDNDAIRFYSNGKLYYLRKGQINYWDEQLLFCKNNNIKALFILYNSKYLDQTFSPYFMAYPDARDSSSTIWAFDTSNEYGAGYFTAAMEFLAERYSREDGEFGHVSRFVIGNEVDVSWEWNPIYNYDKTEPLTLEQYVEEYARSLRLADQATKKYYSGSMVLVSTTHYWAFAPTVKGAYSTKAMYDYLNAKVLYQGNYNWGMAGHPYPEDLANPNFLETETTRKYITGDFNTTSYITWTNLEVLDCYLSQDELLYNGQLRKVYLTEGGVSSGAYGFRETVYNPLQAAGVAYAYYKSMSMDCIDAFIYYKMIDTPADGAGLNFGLYKMDGEEKKPSYDVFKYMDTQYSFVVANQYLSSIRYRLNGVIYSTNNGNLTSYYDAMKITDSGFNWQEKWNESKIIVRQIETVPELESLLG